MYLSLKLLLLYLIEYDFDLVIEYDFDLPIEYEFVYHDFDLDLVSNTTSRSISQWYNLGAQGARKYHLLAGAFITSNKCPLNGMGEEFCSEEVCSSVLEFSKGVLEQVFEEFEDAELERQYELLHTSSLQNSSPIPFNGHLLEVINAPANKWSLRAPWAPKLYHCEIEREVVFEYEIEIVVVV